MGTQLGTDTHTGMERISMSYCDLRSADSRSTPVLDALKKKSYNPWWIDGATGAAVVVAIADDVMWDTTAQSRYNIRKNYICESSARGRKGWRGTHTPHELLWPPGAIVIRPKVVWVSWQQKERRAIRVLATDNPIADVTTLPGKSIIGKNKAGSDI